MNFPRSFSLRSDVSDDSLSDISRSGVRMSSDDESCDSHVGEDDLSTLQRDSHYLKKKISKQCKEMSQSSDLIGVYKWYHEWKTKKREDKIKFLYESLHPRLLAAEESLDHWLHSILEKKTAALALGSSLYREMEHAVGHCQNRIDLYDEILNDCLQIGCDLRKEMLELKSALEFNEEVVQEEKKSPSKTRKSIDIIVLPTEVSENSENQVVETLPIEIDPQDAVEGQNPDESTGNDDTPQVVASEPAVWQGYQGVEGKYIFIRTPTSSSEDVCFTSNPSSPGSPNTHHDIVVSFDDGLIHMPTRTQHTSLSSASGLISQPIVSSPNKSSNRGSPSTSRRKKHVSLTRPAPPSGHSPNSKDVSKRFSWRGITEKSPRQKPNPPSSAHETKSSPLKLFSKTSNLFNNVFATLAHSLTSESSGSGSGSDLESLESESSSPRSSLTAQQSSSAINDASRNKLRDRKSSSPSTKAKRVKDVRGRDVSKYAAPTATAITNLQRTRSCSSERGGGLSVSSSSCSLNSMLVEANTKACNSDMKALESLYHESNVLINQLPSIDRDIEEIRSKIKELYEIKINIVHLIMDLKSSREIAQNQMKTCKSLRDELRMICMSSQKEPNAPSSSYLTSMPSFQRMSSLDSHDSISTVSTYDNQDSSHDYSVSGQSFSMDDLVSSCYASPTPSPHPSPVRNKFSCSTSSINDSSQFALDCITELKSIMKEETMVKSQLSNLESLIVSTDEIASTSTAAH